MIYGARKGGIPHDRESLSLLGSLDDQGRMVVLCGVVVVRVPDRPNLCNMKSEKNAKHMFCRHYIHITLNCISHKN